MSARSGLSRLTKSNLFEPTQHTKLVFKIFMAPNDETYVSFDSNDNSIGSASEIPTQKLFVYFVGNRIGPRVDPWGTTPKSSMKNRECFLCKCTVVVPVAHL
jgi:hypothetical protein